MRLDQYLLEQGLAASRSKAQQLIEERCVLVDDRVVEKNAFEITTQRVRVVGDEPYVSRAALKLKSFLPLLPFTCRGLRVLDIGASTGGFTQILLESGALGVDAVDVGTDQLHPSLRTDARVRSFEQCDIRSFESDEPYALVTCDVSFIALEHILGAIDRLSACWIIVLFKPQFEVGREAKRDKNGVVTDEKAIGRAMMRFEDACSVLGWRLIEKERAHIKGKEGNVEYCYCFKKD